MQFLRFLRHMFFVLALCISHIAAANNKTDTYTFGIGVGTGIMLGHQFFVTLPLDAERNFSARLMHNDLKPILNSIDSIPEKSQVDNITYENDISWSTTGAIFDWHPGVNGFALSLGVLKNNISVLASAHLTEGITYGNITLGNINARANLNISFADYSPYLGIRFGNALAAGIPLSLYFDFGVLVLGKPNTNYALSRTLTDTSDNIIQQADISKEEDKIKDELSDLTKKNIILPVLTLGIQYSF